jgi:hypothetical protein
MIPTAIINSLGKIINIKIEVGRQVNETRNEVIDMLLHEELEARVLLAKTNFKNAIKIIRKRILRLYQESYK